MQIGNKAKLVNSETCQKCGACCKVFDMSFELDETIRFIWMDNKKIKGIDTPFRFGDGIQRKDVTFKFPCKHLEFRDNKYWCKVWDKERPNFCNTYPDHLFYNIERWNRDRIKKTLEWEGERCIGLRKVSVDDVIKMLNERRKDEGVD